MPHAEDPTQLDTEASVVVDQTADTGAVNDFNSFTDPRGQYLMTAELGSSAADGSRTLFKIENRGVDLRIDAVHAIGSEGGENGRGYAYFGWDENNAYATDWIAPKLGLNGASGAWGRQTETYSFPEDSRPLWEFKDELYVAHQPSSPGTDSFKIFTAIRAVPDDHSETESRL